MRRRGGTADAGKAQIGVSVSASRGFGEKRHGGASWPGKTIILNPSPTSTPNPPLPQIGVSTIRP